MLQHYTLQQTLMGVDLLSIPSTKAEYQVKGGFLLDVVVGEGTAILELLSGEDQTLLVRGDSLLVLDLGLHALDGVGALYLEGDSLPRQGLHEDLHSTAKAKDQVKGGFLLDVVVGEGTAVLELLSGKDKTLLIGRDSFLVLDLGLHRVDGVRAFHLEGDGLASQGLYEDLQENVSINSKWDE
jgi:hypothetical protein